MLLVCLYRLRTSSSHPLAVLLVVEPAPIASSILRWPIPLMLIRFISDHRIKSPEGKISYGNRVSLAEDGDV